MKSVSWSRIKLRRRCHRAYYYKYVEKIDRKRKSLPLFRGSILHEMLNARANRAINPRNKKLPTPQKVLDGYAKRYRELLEAEREYYGDLIGECQTIFAGYERTWKDEEFKYISSEQEIIVPLNGVNVPFLAYLDKVVRDSDGNLWLMEHKTHKSIPDDETRFVDLQSVQYLWGYNKLNPKAPLNGVVWDYLRTKIPTVPEKLIKGGLTQRANIDTDYYTYLNAINDNGLNPVHYKPILDKLKNEPNQFYQRFRLPTPSKDVIRSMVADMKEAVRELASWGEGTPSKDRNMTRDCTHMCDFFPLCNAELRGLDAAYVRKAEFKPREDDRNATESSSD